MNSYMKWKKCMNFISFSPATTVTADKAFMSPTPNSAVSADHQGLLSNSKPGQRKDGRHVGPRRTGHTLGVEHMTPWEPGQSN